MYLLMNLSSFKTLVIYKIVLILKRFTACITNKICHCCWCNFWIILSFLIKICRFSFPYTALNCYVTSSCDRTLTRFTTYLICLFLLWVIFFKCFLYMIYIPEFYIAVEALK